MNGVTVYGICRYTFLPLNLAVEGGHRRYQRHQSPKSLICTIYKVFLMEHNYADLESCNWLLQWWWEVVTGVVGR
jgi:hypothetical protein